MTYSVYNIKVDNIIQTIAATVGWVLTSPTVGGELKFTLTSPFTWDGSSPIKIIIFTYGHSGSLGSTNGYGGSSGTSGSWGMRNSTDENTVRGSNTWSLQGTGRVFVKFDTQC